MKQSNYIVQIIEPSNDGWLTQKEEVEIKNRIFSKKIFLAVNDKADNYKEITEEFPFVYLYKKIIGLFSLDSILLNPVSYSIGENLMKNVGQPFSIG